VREQLPANAPAPFVAAQTRAKELIDKTLPRIGKLKVHVDAPEDAKLTLKIDGAPVSVAMLDLDRASDPGKHVVEVSAPGYATSTEEVTVGEGASATVSLRIAREKPKPKPEDDDATARVKPKPKPEDDDTTTAKPKPKPKPDEDADDDDDDAPKKKKPPMRTPPSEPGGPSRVAPIIMFATAGVGIGVGAIFGLMASGKAGDLDKVCVNKGCPASAKSDISTMKSDATISTVGFGVGIAAAAVGTYLWLAAGGEAPKPGHAYVQPMIGVGFIGVRGAL
jgi:hypothetical protein